MTAMVRTSCSETRRPSLHTCLSKPSRLLGYSTILKDSHTTSHGQRRSARLCSVFRRRAADGHCRCNRPGRESVAILSPEPVDLTRQIRPQQFDLDYAKLNTYIHRELKKLWGLGPADNVRILPNGDIIPPVGDDVLGNVYDILE